MITIEIVCPSEENTCRTLKATYAKVSAANVIGQQNRGGKLYGFRSDVYI